MINRLLTLCLIGLFSSGVFAQSAAFTYQGKLTDAGIAASGQYDLIFRLFDGGGLQIGPDLARDNVQVTAGIFTVTLNFGSAPFTTGVADTLEIAVRPGTSTGVYTTLAPRQPLTSSPFSIKAVGATAADGLSSACALCVTDAHIQSIDGSKVTGIVANASSALTAVSVSGIVPIVNGGTGSPTKSFVDLSTDQAAIAGNKTFMGSVNVTGANGVFTGNGAGLTNLSGGNIGPGTVTPAQLSPDALPTGRNLLLLGSLRWDLLKGQASFPVGSVPEGVVFDGANLWTANSGSNNVTKIRAVDGANLGTFATGSAPHGIAFDGSNIWTVNHNSNNVTKLRASDGANLGSFAVGGQPERVAFDGANIWVTNTATHDVTKLRANDGSNLGSFPAGTFPLAIAFDGSNMWVTDAASNTVVRLRASDGQSLGNVTIGTGPAGIAFDGENMWIAQGLPGGVSKVRANDGAVLGAFGISGVPYDIAFDGTNIWVTSSSSVNSQSPVTKMRTSDGSHQGVFTIPAFPRGIAFDGTNMWTVINAPSGSIMRLSPAFPQP